MLTRAPSSRSLRVVCLGLFTGWGCGAPATHFPAVASGFDGGPVDRFLAEAPAVPDRPTDLSTDGLSPGDGADVPAAPTDAGDDAPVADGNLSDSVGPTLLVNIASPLAAAVVVGQIRFAPSVSVTSSSGSRAAPDAVQDVSAALLNPITKTRIRSVKLTQTGLEVTPESNTIIYRFGDTPLEVSDQPSGTFELLVEVATVFGTRAEARLTFTIDAGPGIRIDSPLEGKAFRGSAPVDVSISDDLFGPVSGITMTLGQRPLTFMGPGGTSQTQYTATIDFNAFGAPLEGDQLLTVRAKNKNGTFSEVTRRFVSDSKGPAIAKTIPKVGDLIGKVVEISAEITDPSGVLDSSVVVVLAHGGTTFQRNLDPPPAGSKERIYRTLFDTSQILPANAIFPSISFRASDVLGNESSVGYLVSFDNTPPLVDLDPPEDFRALKADSFGVYHCSWKFDPVGPDATDDGDLVSQLFDLRARIEDQGNRVASGQQDFSPIAGVEEGKAQLLVLDDISQPLLVDTDGDGKCDAVNPLLTPTTTPKSSTDALLINMTPIPVLGGADHTADPSAAPCPLGDAALKPFPVCPTTYNFAKGQGEVSDLHGVAMVGYLPYASARLPAIWGVPPVADDMLQCAGRQFDASANNLKDGWACIAVAVADKLGNSQVSRPLRVCIDHDGDGKECPHRALAKVQPTTPVTLETAKPHGLVTGASVIVRGIVGQASVNGAWTIDVVDATHLALRGSMGRLADGEAIGGWVVAASEIPNCTGTQTAKGPPPVVSTKACLPWRLFPANERREF